MKVFEQTCNNQSVPGKWHCVEFGMTIERFSYTVTVKFPIQLGRTFFQKGVQVRKRHFRFLENEIERNDHFWMRQYDEIVSFDHS